MHAHLPPLRLTGALTLRDGQLQRRSVAIAEGVVSTGPLPAVDLSGFYVLPGIVDASASDPIAQPDGTVIGTRKLDRAAAERGITTRYLSLPWSWESPAQAPAATARLARAHAADRAMAATDLRLQLACETVMTHAADTLLDLVDDGVVQSVAFTTRAELARDLRRADPDGFGHWAWTRGCDAATLSAALDAALARETAVPRHLCRLAEAFDDAGLVYGSAGDRSAEMREHFSMFGARLCLAPGSARVAAVARAVGDPVLAPAADLLTPGSDRPGPRTAALLNAGHCDGLISGPSPVAPAAAAFHLVDLGLMGLARAWSLISTAPAAILRLHDRGRIDPGLRADLTVINARTRAVEATIAGGRMAHLTGTAAMRFAAAAPSAQLAAE